MRRTLRICLLVIPIAVVVLAVAIPFTARVLQLAAASCPCPPDEAIPLPDTVPASVTYVDKEGKPWTVNGPTEYREGFKAGWKQCEEHNKFGTLNGPLNLSMRREDIVDEQEPRFFGEARRDGYLACLAVLRRRAGLPE